MIRFAIPLIAFAIGAVPATFATAQTFTEAEQAAIARIEAETPIVHAMMVEMGRYDVIVSSHDFWLGAMSDRWFGAYDPSLWEDQTAQAFTSDQLLLDYAAAVADLPLTQAMVDDATAFYTSDLAQRIQAIETDITRIRIRDEAQYDAALVAFQEIAGTDDPRAAILLRAEEVGQYVDNLVNRTFDEELALLHGLREAGYFQEEMTDDDLRGRVQVDRDAIRPDVEDYYNVYHMMMLDEITVAEFATYLDFLGDDNGRVIADFLADGSDAITWSYRVAVGRVIAPLWIAEWEAEQETTEAAE